MLVPPPEKTTSILSLTPLINAFFVCVEQGDIDLYNEISLQHELGIYLKNALPDYRVQFERNVSFFVNTGNTIKKEIDISIFSHDKKERYAIELKYPLNGQYPEQLYSFVKDVKFMEQLKALGFRHTYCVSLVADRPFYHGRDNPGIYQYFREINKIYGRIHKPTGKGKHRECIELKGTYPFVWQALSNGRMFYCIEM